jgi:hypothetical protein
MVRAARIGLTAIVTGVVSLTAVAGAQAAITTSNITTPADGTRLLDNLVAATGSTFTVAGTTNGTSADSDAVDIQCYSDGATYGHSYDGPAGTGIPVGADGSFTATVPASDFDGTSCELLAVPHGTTPSPGTSYTGPRVGFSKFDTSAVGGNGPNQNDLQDFYFGDFGLSGWTAVSSVGDCGSQDAIYDASATMSGGPELFYCAGSFYDYASEFDSTAGFDLTRSEIEVDGANAYNSSDADGITSSSTGNTGFPALTATLDSFDPSTGDAQTTESESLVECSPTNVYAPTATDCASFVSSGVSLTRVTRFTGDGRIATVTDTYSSTDGKQHALDLEYETDLDATAAGWELPGQSTFSAHSTGDTGPAPAAGPGTAYAIEDTADAPALTNPVGAETFATPYNSVTFDNTLWSKDGEVSAQFDYQRTVPAGGSVTIAWSYAIGSTLAAVRSDAAAAQDGFEPPAITISAPAHSATETRTPVTVTGTATAGSGVKSVTVNGVTASVSGGSFNASVPVSHGPNTITARVTSDAGNSATASVTVNYPTPAVEPVAPKALKVAVTPRSDRHKPYRYNLSGKLVLPPGVSAKTGCSGTVTVRVKHGKKTLSTRKLRITTSCTYSSKFSLRLKSHGKLSFDAAFGGNSVLKSLTARPVQVSFG